MSCRAHIECYFRPFASVHAQWIAASVNRMNVLAGVGLCWKKNVCAHVNQHPHAFPTAFMPSCRCAHQLNAASVPSQAFMLSGLLLPSIRIQISLVNENVLQISLATLNPQQIRDTFLNIRNRIQTQQCKFVLVRKRSCSVDWLLLPSLHKRSCSVDCCFRPFGFMLSPDVLHSSANWSARGSENSPQQIRDTS